MKLPDVPDPGDLAPRTFLANNRFLLHTRSSHGYAAGGREIISMHINGKLLTLVSGAAAALAGVGVAPALRAAVIYSHATQTISNVTLSPTVSTSNFSTFAQDAAIQNGSGIANSDPLDAPQAYLGGAPAAPQNFYARYAPGNPPVSPAGNFTRGDSITSGTLAGAKSVIAESYLNTA